jgi:Acetyltransferase (GNAT) domain
MVGEIRAAQLDDLPAVAKLLLRVYQFEPSDHHADLELLEWKYLRARPGWEGSRSYLIEKDGQIVAHCGICPVTFRLPDGNVVNSLTMMDWAADPTVKGAGRMLFRKLMEMAPTSFIIGGTAATRNILPRIDFRPAGETLAFTGWLRPWQEFRLRPHTRRSIPRLLHGLTHPARNRSGGSAEWDFVGVTRFDNSLLTSLQGTKREWTFCQRTLADLNYMLDCPHVKMEGFLLRRQGQLVGYFIIGKMEWEARLLDLVVDSADPNDWILASMMVTKAARLYPEVCRIRVQSSFPILKQALEWNGYRCLYKEPLMLYDPANVLDAAFPLSIQLFDGDYGY